MYKRDPKLFLLDILESIEKIESYIHGLSHGDFVEDSKTQDAVVRNLEIIGEAARALPEELRRKHYHIPWKQIIGLRNRLAHGYFVVDLDIVWEIVTKELPELKKQIQGILKGRENENP